MKYKTEWAFLVPELCICIKTVEDFKEFGALLHLMKQI